MRVAGVVVGLALVACGSSSNTAPGANAGSGPGGGAGDAASGAASGAGLSSAGDSGARATGGAAGMSSAAGGAAGMTSVTAGAAGAGGAAGSAGSSPVGSIVSDVGDHLIVHGVPKDAHLSAVLKDGKPITNGQWLIDDDRIGTLGDDHVFHANGFVGGVVIVSVLTGTTAVRTKLTVDVDIVENSAALANTDQAALAAGGPPDPKFKFLYPYDGTVFPRGLSAPLLQFGDGKTATALSADALYLKLTTAHFSYQSYALAGSPVHLGIPEPVWRGVTLTAGALDAVTVAVSKRTSGVVAGPVSEAWRIAQGTLKGLIYYSSYISPLLPFSAASGSGGGILSIRAGETAKVVQKGCVTCHSVSDKGSVLSASVGPDLALPTASVAYNLDPTGSATPRGSMLTDGRAYSFAALTPDGSKAVSNGIPLSSIPPQLPRGLSGNDGYQSVLIDTLTGAPVPSASLSGLVKYAQTPSFSGDGKTLAFINGDKWPLRQLATVSFDGTSIFSSLKTIVSNTSEMTSAFGAPQPQDLSWPAFTPDSAAIVYQQGDSFDSAGLALESGLAPSKPQYAEIRLTELDGTVKKLNALNGRDGNGSSYLPYGETAENRMDYEPATVPVAVGGYFWVVFVSRRTYGNSIAPGRTKTSLSFDDPSQDPWGSDAGPSPRKKLWLAAIDINHTGKLDPSHPALYVPGQELESANQRHVLRCPPANRMLGPAHRAPIVAPAIAASRAKMPWASSRGSVTRRSRARARMWTKRASPPTIAAM